MSVSSGMADCAVAPDGLCLRIAPPESLDVTKLAHAFVTLARPRRGCRSRAAWLCAVLGPRRRPADQDSTQASTRGQQWWPAWACWPDVCYRTTRPPSGKLIVVVAVNVRRRGPAPGQVGSSRRRPDCPLAASTGTSPDGDLQTSHAAPSRQSAPGDVDRRHHAE